VVLRVVEGAAGALSCFARSTEDLDLLLDASPDNLERLLATLAQFGDGYARELRPSDFSDEEGAIQLVEDFPIDMFVRMGGLRYADLLAHRRTNEIGGVAIPYVDVDGLLLLKSGSLRPRDQIDVEILTRLKAGKYGPQA
jgi:hypothetical protein